MKLFLYFPLLLLLTACVTPPAYRDVAQDKGEVNPRDVNYQVFSDLYRDPPDCVVVMAAKTEDHQDVGAQVSRAVARYMGGKVDRVIFPRHRDRLSQKRGLDLDNAGDRRRFAHQTRCRFYIRAELYDLGDDFVGIYAQKHVGVRLDLARFEDDKPLWQAAHTVWRADGGLPLSPIGAIGGVAQAALFAQDQEVMSSIIDDGVRRMMRTLPIDY